MLILTIKEQGQGVFVRESNRKVLIDFHEEKREIIRVLKIEDKSWKYFQTNEAVASLNGISKHDWKAFTKKKRLETFLLSISDGNKFSYEIIEEKEDEI